MIIPTIIGAVLFSGQAFAQYPPPPEGLKWIDSKVLLGVTLSYKKVPVRRHPSLPNYIELG